MLKSEVEGGDMSEQKSKMDLLIEELEQADLDTDRAIFGVFDEDYAFGEASDIIKKYGVVRMSKDWVTKRGCDICKDELESFNLCPTWNASELYVMYYQLIAEVGGKTYMLRYKYSSFIDFGYEGMTMQEVKPVQVTKTEYQVVENEQ